MAILAAGTHPSHFLPIDASDEDDQTTAAELAPYCLNSVDKTGGTPIFLPDFAAQSTLWASQYRFVTYWAAGDLFIFRNNGVDIARVRQSTSGSGPGNIQLEIYNGTSWDDVLAGSDYTFPTSNRIRFDVKLVIADTGGEFILYVNGVEQLNFTGDTLRNGQSTCNEVGVGQIKGGSVASQRDIISGVFVSDTESRNIEMQQLNPIGNGFHTAWSGDYLDVDDVGQPDAAFIDSSVANQLETFTKTALDAAFNSGYNLTLGVCARALRGAAGPQNLQMVCRSGTTDGVSSTIGLDITYAPKFAEFVNDPDTAAAWAFAAMDSAQIGVKSIT